MTVDKNCQTCTKLQVCKMFESASSLKNEFDQRFGDFAPLPIDPADLAIRCEQFIDIRKSESVNVEVARTFIFKE